MTDRVSDESEKIERQLRGRAAGDVLRNYTDRMAADDIRAADTIATLRQQLAAAERERVKLRAAYTAVRASITRFPGSVHDRAMAKIDKALGRTDTVFVDPDEARADKAEAALAAAKTAAWIEARDAAARTAASMDELGFKPSTMAGRIRTLQPPYPSPVEAVAESGSEARS